MMKTRRYPSESLLTDEDFWQRAHEQYIRNIPDDAEALPIDAAADYAEIGDRIKGRLLVRRIIPGDMFAVVAKGG